MYSSRKAIPRPIISETIKAIARFITTLGSTGSGAAGGLSLASFRMDTFCTLNREGISCLNTSEMAFTISAAL
ncbi:hypothetical protein D3C75_1188260 [compost metagenome]